MEINQVNLKPLVNSVQQRDNGLQKEDDSFGDLFKASLQRVNKLQHKANQASEDLALGKVDNVHEVMISAQKAKLSLNLTTAITKKAVSAYQEIMRIRV